MEKLEKQKCIFCHEDKLTLMQDELDIPYFGKVFVFSMKCEGCNFSKSDVEAAQIREPSKITFTVENKKDLNVRVVKSSSASIKIPGLKIDSRPGPASEGFVSNIEGLLERFKKILESARDNSEEEEDKKAVKNLLKKLWRVECGDEPLKIIIEDPTGNSGIISDKTIVEKVKPSK